MLGSTPIFKRSLCPNYATDFFFSLTSINVKVLLKLHIKCQTKIPSRSGENSNFISFAIFINGGLLEFSTRLNFTILMSWSLIIMHMKFEIHECSGFKRISLLNGLKC